MGPMKVKMSVSFLPQASLSREDTGRGLRILTLESMASSGFASITSSAFLIAFALALGANNFQIGILAAIPLITDLFQIPAVWLVEKLRNRKAIVFSTWLISLSLWIPIAFLPLSIGVASNKVIFMLMGLMAIRGIMNAFSNCGWNSWLRDLIPQPVLEGYLSRQLSLATVVSIVTGLGIAFFLGYWDASGSGAMGFSYLLLLGLLIFGLASPVLMLLIPEPMMQPLISPRPSFLKIVTAPCRERNYRQLMKFLLFWGFATSMAFPFFEVLMLSQLNLSIMNVIILVTVTDIFTAISLRTWGTLSDRLGSKAIMSYSVSLFLIALLGWSVVVIYGRGIFLVPLLMLLHIIQGISLAGILLAREVLSLKLSPKGKATAHTTGASLADSVGTSIGMITGGFLAELFSGGKLNLNLPHLNPAGSQADGFLFLFLLALAVGILTLKILQNLQEGDKARESSILNILCSAVTRAYRPAHQALLKNQAIWLPSRCIRLTAEKGPAADLPPCYLAASMPSLPKVVINLTGNLQKKPPSTLSGKSLSILLS